MISAHELGHLLLAGPDARVIMQKDGDGNSYSPCGGMRLGHYRPHNAWDGWVYDAPPVHGSPCVVLEPIN